MTKEQYLAQRKALMEEAQAAIDASDVETFNAKKAAVDALDEKYENLAKAQANMNAMKDNQVVQAAQTIKLGNEGQILDKVNEVSDKNKVDAENRGKALKANNAVTVASSNIVLPKHTGDTINPTFNQVSGLLDRVSVKQLIGGESFTQPFVSGYGEGDYKGENADYAEAETTFGYAPINKAKVTAYAEGSEELIKLPAADYDSEVVKGVTVATRKKITRQILVGAGGTNQLVGIFSAVVTNTNPNTGPIDATTDLEVTTITNTTLDDIVFAYGGDEEVEDAAVLILNKKDLAAFAKLRSTSGEKLHTIVTNGNTGTIDGYPFIINSACKAISDATTTNGQFAMAYGSLSNYTLAVFSDTDVQRSSDYKFKQGMIAHRASTFIGGNVTAKNGFLRIKKKVVAG